MSVLSEVASANHPSLTLDNTGRSARCVNAGAAQGAASRRVVMLVANEFTHDTRVFKQARSLTQWGCEVHVIATAGVGLPTRQQLEGIQIHRVEVRSGRVWWMGL